MSDLLPFRALGPATGQGRADALTVADVIAYYLEAREIQLRGGALSVDAFKNSRRLLRVFESHFGPLPVSQCRQSDLVRFLHLHPEWQSPDAKITAVGAVVACFRWAAMEPIIDRCPYTRPKGLIPPPQPRKAITPEEVRRLLSEARHHGYRPTRRAFRLIVWFLWETGCRTCEAREITWGEIDWSAGVIRKAKHKTARTGQDRIIPLSDRVLRLLGWLRRVTVMLPSHGGNTDRPIFCNGRNRPWTRHQLAKNFRVYAARIGLRKELSAYCLRHGFTVQGLENEVGARQLADVLGHSSTRYVDWYGRASKAQADYLRRSADQVHGRRKKPP